MALNLGQFRLHVWVVAAVLVGGTGCRSTMPITEGYPHQTAMRGKTRAEVLQCAGAPLRERQTDTVTELYYYREAPILEESGIATKGSLPKVHHGCWVSVILREDLVQKVRYQFVPEFFNASNDCEEVFVNCGAP